MGKVVCITGMHRSGTSLLANWVNNLGVKLDFGNLIKPEFWNKQGHYEDESLVKFQSDILLKHYGMSDGWKVFKDSFIDFSSEEEDVARSIIQTRLDAPYWGWKDPRSLFFIPNWLKINPNMTVLIVWRPALDVVTSLIARSNIAQKETPNYSDLLFINFNKSILLWNTYNKLAIKLNNMFPDNVYIVALEDIINRDKEIYFGIQRKVSYQLSYKPIKEVLDIKLLGSNKVNFGFSDIVRIKIMTHRVQRRLNALS